MAIARGKDPVADYGVKIGRALNEQIDKMIEEVDDPYIDNVRFAARYRADDMRRYHERKLDGC